MVESSCAWRMWGQASRGCLSRRPCASKRRCAQVLAALGQRVEWEHAEADASADAAVHKDQPLPVYAYVRKCRVPVAARDGALL